MNEKVHKVSFLRFLFIKKKTLLNEIKIENAKNIEDRKCKKYRNLFELHTHNYGR